MIFFNLSFFKITAPSWQLVWRKNSLPNEKIIHLKYREVILMRKCTQLIINVNIVNKYSSSESFSKCSICACYCVKITKLYTQISHQILRMIIVLSERKKYSALYCWVQGLSSKARSDWLFKTMPMQLLMVYLPKGKREQW